MVRITSYFILMSLVLNACDSQKEKTTESEKAIPVITEEVKKTSVAQEIAVSGNIEGNKTVRLGFMVAGKINFIGAEEGQMVTKGKLLSSLDPTNYGIAKEIADIQVNQVKDEFNRLKQMHDRKSISESDFSKIGFGVQQAEAQQKLQTKNLADTRLYSPISGVLLKKMAETGEIVGVGSPIFVVSDIRKVKVNAYIPEGELHAVKIGQSAVVTVSSLNEVVTGKVTEVGSAADAASRAFTIKIVLDNPRLRIRPGMIAEVKLAGNLNKDIVILPVESVLHDIDNQSYVFVVDPTQNKAFKRKVSLGRLLANQIEITSGISEKDIVVTGGQQKLNDGSLISRQ